MKPIRTLLALAFASVFASSAALAESCLKPDAAKGCCAEKSACCPVSDKEAAKACCAEKAACCPTSEKAAKSCCAEKPACCDSAKKDAKKSQTPSGK